MPKGESSYFGFGRETQFAEPVAPDNFWKVLSCNVSWGRDMSKRFLIGNSAQQSEMVQKGWTQKGDITLDANPVATGQILYWLFGRDSVAAVPEAKSGGASTTLSSQAPAGAATIEVASSDGLAVNDWVAVGAGQVCEFAKIVSVNGAMLGIEAKGISGGLVFAHDIGSPVVENVPDIAYKHTFSQSGTVPSQTWELDLGAPDGHSAARFSGMMTESCSISMLPAEPVSVSASFVGSKMSAHNTRATPVYQECESFKPAGSSITIEGTPKTSLVKSLKLSVSNGLEASERTLSSGAFISKGSAGTISAELDAEALFEDDAELQRFLGGDGADYVAKSETKPFACVVEMQGALVGPSSAISGSLKVTLPKCYMTACSVPVQVGRKTAQSWKTSATFSQSDGFAMKAELVCGKYSFL